MISNESPMERLLRKVINDRNVFDYGKGNSGCLIARSEMPQFRTWLETEDLESVRRFLERKIGKLQEEILKTDGKSDLRDFAQRLKNGLDSYRHYLVRICNLLDDFGILRCKLPNMEDYGRVVERESRAVVEQFFSYKIDKEANKWRREALKRLREYLAWGYDQGISSEHLGFFVRKIESLERLTEV